MRAGYLWWILVLVFAGMEGFALVAPWDTTTDHEGVCALVGCFLGGAVAVATSRWIIEERSLVGVGILRKFRIDADQIADIDDANGLAVVLHSGHRIELGISEPSAAQLVLRNRRRRREAAVIRAWLSSVGSASVAGWQASRWTTTIRWAAVVGIIGAAAISPVLVVVGAV